MHSSLRSFGYVEGGAETVIEALTESFETILIPGFCGAAKSMPPLDDRPIQNACDYTEEDYFIPSMAPFSIESAEVDHKMGVISQAFAQRIDVIRSNHPWHSWLVWGYQAEELAKNHAWDTTNLPLERLTATGGWVLLLGVTLTSCTAIHIAEERAGRRPFIRWATDRNGNVRRVRVAGCAKGFEKLMPYCQTLFKETHIGDCHVLTAPLEPLITSLTPVIRDHQTMTQCSDTCLRCRDTSLGGPIDIPKGAVA